jgi:hypothetical protein
MQSEEESPKLGDLLWESQPKYMKVLLKFVGFPLWTLWMVSILIGMPSSDILMIVFIAMAALCALSMWYVAMAMWRNDI